MNLILDDSVLKIEEVNGQVRFGPSQGNPIIELGVEETIGHFKSAGKASNDHANRVNFEGYAVLTFSNDGGSNYTIRLIVVGKPRDPVCTSTITGAKLKEICNVLASTKGKEEAA